MAGNAPRRTRDVYLIGAGVGSAFGIPNTQQLLNEVHALAETPGVWAHSIDLGKTLDEAYQFFYPIEAGSDRGFRPTVVDFFSVLKSYATMSRGLPGRFTAAEELEVMLRRALAHVLIRRLHDCDKLLRREHEALHRILAPGNLVITSNWDVLLERYAQHHDLPIRHSFADSTTEATILKLHGSIDWCQRSRAKRPVRRPEYVSLRERLWGRPYPISIGKGEQVIRIRALEDWSSAWQRIKSRASEPLMITMSLGKAPELEQLRPVWRDAYGAISRARHLSVIGYSMPEDDIEIRTLLVAGLERSDGSNARVTLQNPSPEVHGRFREAIRRSFESVYLPLQGG